MFVSGLGDKFLPIYFSGTLGTVSSPWFTIVQLPYQASHIPLCDRPVGSSPEVYEKPCSWSLGLSPGLAITPGVQTHLIAHRSDLQCPLCYWHLGF